MFGMRLIRMQKYTMADLMIIFFTWADKLSDQNELWPHIDTKCLDAELLMHVHLRSTCSTRHRISSMHIQLHAGES